MEPSRGTIMSPSWALEPDDGGCSARAEATARRGDRPSCTKLRRSGTVDPSALQRMLSGAVQAAVSGLRKAKAR